MSIKVTHPTYTGAIEPHRAFSDSPTLDYAHLIPRMDSTSSSLPKERVSIPKLPIPSEVTTILQIEGNTLSRERPVYNTLSSVQMTPKDGEQKKENLAKIQKALNAIAEEPRTEIRLWMTSELLAKTFAYSKPKISMTIYLPSFKEGSGMGMVAYTFRPIRLHHRTPLLLLTPLTGEQDAPPFLVFRGTTKHDLNSIFSDLNVDAIRYGIGATIFKNSAKSLETILTVLNNNFRVNPVICGHSLGGSLAQKTAVHFHDKVGPVFAFSSPKASKADAQKWASIPDEEKSPLWVTNTKGDSIVSRAGSVRIGTWIIVDNPHAKSASQRHGQTVLNQKDIVLEGACPIKPRSSRMQRIIELIQMIFSFIFIEPLHRIYLRQAWTVETSPIPIAAFSSEQEALKELKRHVDMVRQNYTNGLLDREATLATLLALLDVDADLWWKEQIPARRRYSDSNLPQAIPRLSATASPATI